MSPLGYCRLIELLNLEVAPLRRPIYASPSVNSRTEEEGKVLFPMRVLRGESAVWHLEFAVRHEGINLEIIDAVFEKLDRATLIARFREAPTGAYIRRICFLFEWLTGEPLETKGVRNGGYVDLFDRDEYYTSAVDTRAPKFRVRNNALGNANFCPVVRRSAVQLDPPLSVLLQEARTTLEAVSDPELYQRALSYLYLSETRGSFAIENETPSGNRQQRFVELLRHAGEPAVVNEAWLVGLQNAIVRDVYAQEASYRTKQNWMEDATGRVTYIPAPIEALRQIMSGWEAFSNDESRCTDWLVKTACVAFGFVYLHPFLDGNGRIHRFLIQHLLARSRMALDGVVIPVSAVIGKNLPRYREVLVGFSAPVTTLWDYRRVGGDEPHFTHSANSRAYRFFNADAEIQFLHAMIVQAVRDEIPREIAFLNTYDEAYATLNAELDLPQPTLSALIRNIHGNKGLLSKNTRKKYFHYSDELLDRVVTVVRQAFGFESNQS